MGVGAALIGSAALGLISSDRAADRARRDAAREREALAALQNEPEPSLPDPEAIKRARRRSITGQMRRRGRASTILTDTATATAAEPLGA